MNIIEFKYIDKNDICDLKFQHSICWSRIYEYPLVLQKIKEFGVDNPKIHNCSWGFRDIHIVFKTWLDILFNQVTHSDIKGSSFYNTEVWDIRYPSQYQDEFDVVLNISTLEEVPHSDHVTLIKHHLDQVKPGGIFVLTFDYPGFQLEKVEDFLGQKIQDTEWRLNPRNSEKPDEVLNLPDDFNVGYLIIQK